MNKVLIVEDDELIAELERDYLEAGGFEVELIFDGNEGLNRAMAGGWDALILDVMLPGKSGFEVCREVRKSLHLPVIMVTAKKEDVDKIRGLGLGADDYLVKPFDVRELLARVRALARRPAPVAVSGRPCCGDLTLDMGTLVLTGDKEQCTLSKKEAELLAALMENAGQTLSRSFLFGRVWGPGADVEEASLDSYVHFIRRRLRAVSSRVTVDTVRGVGYRLLDGGTGA